MKFERLDSVIGSGGGIPVITFDEGVHKRTIHVGNHGMDESEVKKAVKPTEEKMEFDVSESLSENLKRTPENVGWAVKKNCVEGDDRSFLESLVKGTLKIVTDGSHHPEEHVATAAVHVEADDGAALTLILQTPGDQADLQSHGAELSGHFATVSVLELLCDWAKKEDK